MLIPEQHFDGWSMDYISELPSSLGHNTIFSCIDKSTKFVHLIPCFKREGHSLHLSVPIFSFLTSLDYLVY